MSPHGDAVGQSWCAKCLVKAGVEALTKKSNIKTPDKPSANSPEEIFNEIMSPDYDATAKVKAEAWKAYEQARKANLENSIAENLYLSKEIMAGVVSNHIDSQYNVIGPSLRAWMDRWCPEGKEVDEMYGRIERTMTDANEELQSYVA